MKSSLFALILCLGWAATLGASEISGFRLLPRLPLKSAGAADGEPGFIEYEHDREDYVVRHFYFSASETTNKPGGLHSLRSWMNWGVDREHGFDPGWICLRELQNPQFLMAVRVYEAGSPMARQITDWNRMVELLEREQPKWALTPLEGREPVTDRFGDTRAPVYLRAEFDAVGVAETEAIAIIPYEDHVVTVAVRGPTAFWDDVAGDDSSLLLSMMDIRPVSPDRFARD